MNTTMAYKIEFLPRTLRELEELSISIRAHAHNAQAH
jgi:hypothetical protein